jgi:hypothetical protein
VNVVVHVKWLQWKEESNQKEDKKEEKYQNTKTKQNQNDKGQSNLYFLHFLYVGDRWHLFFPITVGSCLVWKFSSMGECLCSACKGYDPGTPVLENTFKILFSSSCGLGSYSSRILFHTPADLLFLQVV